MNKEKKGKENEPRENWSKRKAITNRLVILFRDIIIVELHETKEKKKKKKKKTKVKLKRNFPRKKRTIAD